MRIATWNINGIRARIEGAIAWTKDARPDILCFQEIKCQDDGFPAQAFEELGYKELTEVAWVGLWTTPDVPATAQFRIRAAVLKAMAQPGMRERLQGLGLDPAEGGSPDDLQRGLRVASDRQAATLKAIGFKPE